MQKKVSLFGFVVFSIPLARTLQLQDSHLKYKLMNPEPLRVTLLKKLLKLKRLIKTLHTAHSFILRISK